MQKTTVPVVLKGLSQKEPPGLKLAGTVDELLNYRIERGGPQGFEFRKVNGHAAVSSSVISGGAVTSGRRLTGAYRGELLLQSADRLYSWAPTPAKWVDRGRMTSMTVKTLPICDNSLDQIHPVVCSYQGITVYAWAETIATAASRGYVRYSVYDEATGTALVSDALVESTTANVPKLVGVGDSILMFFESGTTTIRVRRIQVATPTTLGASTLVAATSASQYDVMPWASNTRAAVAVRTAANNVALMLVDQTGAVVTGPVNHVIDQDLIQWADRPNDTTTLYLLTSRDSAGVGINLRAFNGTTLAAGAVTAIDTAGTPNVTRVVGYHDGTQWNVIYENGAGSVNAVLKKTTHNGAATIDSNWQRAAQLWSKPFTLGGNWYAVILANQSQLQASYIILDLATKGIAAKHLMRLGQFGSSRRSGFVASCSVLDASRTISVTTRRTRLYAANYTGVNTVYSAMGINRLEVNVNDALQGPPKVFAENVYFPGGSGLAEYDGTSVHRMGFDFFPEAPTVTSATPGGGAMTPGNVHSYVLVYEYKDQNGQTTFSAPSTPVNGTVGVGHTGFNITAPTNRWTNRTLTAIHLYRTEAGPRTLYYKSSSVTSPSLNDRTADSITIPDTIADSALILREPLYTTGNVLENVAPPPCRVVEVFQNRLFVAGCENESEIWFSKLWEPDRVVGFNEAFIIRVPKDDGPVRALQTVDDKLVALTENGIFVITGEFPNDVLEDKKQIPEPLRLPIAVGSVGPHVARMPDGVVFKSDKGFYLLDRGFGATYIGGPVANYDSYTITGAVVVEDKNQVRFATSNGYTLIYDWHWSRVAGTPIWYVRTNQAAAAATSWGGNYAFLNTDGTVRIESASSYADDGAAIAASLTLSFASFAGLQGLQRVSAVTIAGTALAATQCRATLRYNQDSGTVEALPLFAVDATNVPITIGPKVRGCTSMSVQHEDVGTTAGYAVEALTFLVGIASGMAKYGSTRRITP